MKEADDVSDPLKRLEEITARLATATPGPWRWLYGDERGSFHWLVNDAGVRVHSDGGARGEYNPDIDVWGPDAALIAHAPADLAWLLAELRTALAACEEARRLLAQWDADNTPPTDSSVSEVLRTVRAALVRARGVDPEEITPDLPFRRPTP